MIPEALKEIAQYENKIASLQKKVEAERSKALTNLHTSAGFATREELIAALQSLGKAAPAKRGRKPGKKAAVKKAAKKPAKKAAKKPAKAAKKPAKAAKPAKAGAKKRAKRTRLTPELKERIVAALKAGGKGAAVASKFGVSVPTVHNIKKAAGLTKTRKK